MGNDPGVGVDTTGHTAVPPVVSPSASMHLCEFLHHPMNTDSAGASVDTAGDTVGDFERKIQGGLI